jgi:hypothetical protein
MVGVVVVVGDNVVVVFEERDFCQSKTTANTKAVAIITPDNIFCDFCTSKY